MKIVKLLSMLLLVLSTSMCVSSCSKDDDDSKDYATNISGDYNGDLQIVGYEEVYQAYATLTRKSETAVSLVLDCDDIDFHASPVILDITENDNMYKLTSTSKAVNGTVISDKLSITFATSGGRTYTFIGKK